MQKTVHDNQPEQRHVLFLQGPPCDFFRRVGDQLESMGHRVSRINLCFADWLFWHDHRAINYRGRLSGWEGFLREFLLNHAVTDLVLLGEQRKYHKQAVALAQSLGIRVMVTDFGYFRPDWITLEPNGMGGQSTMPRDPALIRRLAVELDEVDFTPKYRDSSLRMSLGDLAGSFGNVLFKFFYPHYQQSDERPHPFVYFPAMGLSLIRKSMRARISEKKLEHLLMTKRPFFVFPLQLDHDFQIRAYSPFNGMEQAIHRVLESFANNASKDCNLVIKAHPWDPGLVQWGVLIENKARALGISGRVHYLDGGSLDEMIAGSRGVVTVNSTSGLKALQLNRPVQVLGSAVYDIEGLTNASGLDAFWTDPDQPDAQLLDAFIKLLVDQTQVRGVFFDPEGKRSALSQFVNRLVGVGYQGGRTARGHK